MDVMYRLSGTSNIDSSFKIDDSFPVISIESTADDSYPVLISNELTVPSTCAENKIDAKVNVNILIAAPEVIQFPQCISIIFEADVCTLHSTCSLESMSQSLVVNTLKQ